MGIADFRSFGELAKRNRLDILLVLALFLLAFGIRAIPSDRFPNIYGFDSYWDARMTKYIITQGWVFPLNDTTTDYPYGRLALGTLPGFWGLNAFVYKAAAAFGGVSGFNYDLFGNIASWDNAIFASLMIPAIYLLGRWGFNRWVGLAAALLLATSGPHLFYSIYGHAQHNGFGNTMFIFALASFVLTVKTKKYWAGALSFLAFAWLLFVWQIYQVTTLLAAGTVLVYFVAYFALKRMGMYKDSPERQEHRKWMLMALAFVTASGILYPIVVGVTSLAETTLSGGIFVIAVGAAIEYSFSKKDFYRNALAAALASAFIISALIGPSIFLKPLIYTGLMPRETAATAGDDKTARIWTTIAEQNRIPGGFFARLDYLSKSGFGLTIWLALLSVLYLAAKVVIMPFVKKDFTYEWEVMSAAMVFFMLWKLSETGQLTFPLSGAVAFGAGIMLGEAVRIINYFWKSDAARKAYVKCGVLFAIAAMGLSYNTLIIPQAQNFGYDIPQEWFNTFKFLNTVPKDSVVTAWWDYGHWMNYFNGDNIRVTIDNIQDRSDSIHDVARAFTLTPPCKQEKSQDGTAAISCDITKLEQAEIDSLNILRPYETDYILIDKEIVLGKFGALETIAGNGVGCMLGVGAKEQDGRIVTGLSTSAGQLSFSKDEWAQMANTTWPGTPLANIKAFARNDSQGPILYVPAFYRQTAQGVSCDELRGDSPVLYSFTDRLFFKDPGLKHVKLVYEDGWNVIYKVDWASTPRGASVPAR